MNILSYAIDLKTSFFPREFIRRKLAERNVDLNTCNAGTNPIYHRELGLLYPLVADNTVLAYLKGHITDPGLGDFVIFDKSNIEFAVKNTRSFKLLPQTAKAMKTIAGGNKVFNEEYSPYRHSYASGMKLRTNEVIKCIMLGYIQAPSEDKLVNALIDSNYDLGHEIGARNTKGTTFSLTAKVAKIIQVFGKDYSEWTMRNYAQIVAVNLHRTAKELVETDTVKWRKPAKNSVWPWTLDHHWFEVQESAITMANAAYKSLLGHTTSATRMKKDTVDRNYPIFIKQNQLEHGRKILETFFTEALAKKSGSAWGSAAHYVSVMEWTTRVPYYAIPKLCLALGVLPKFSVSGVFERFVPLAGNFNPATRKVYLEMDSIDVDNIHKLEPNFTLILALCYEFGLIGLEDLERTTGIVNAGNALKDSTEHVQVNLGKNLVCCIHTNFAYDVSKASLMKYQQRVIDNAYTADE